MNSLLIFDFYFYLALLFCPGESADLQPDELKLKAQDEFVFALSPTSNLLTSDNQQQT